MRGQRIKRKHTQKQETRCLLGAGRGFAPPPLPDATFSNCSLLITSFGVARTTSSRGLSFHFVIVLDLLLISAVSSLVARTVLFARVHESCCS